MAATDNLKSEARKEGPERKSLPGTVPLYLKTPADPIQPGCVQVTVTNTSQSLAQLLAAVNAAFVVYQEVKRLRLIRVGATVVVYANFGVDAAAGTGFPLPDDFTVEVDSITAADMRFITASGTLAWAVIQEG